MTDYEGFSEYASKAILEHALSKTSWTMPSYCYVALFNGNPFGTGTELDGATATDYARQEIQASSLNSATFSEPTAEVTNSVAISFGTAGNDWGTITHWAIYDADTSGNMIFAAPLEAARSVLSGDTIQFPIGGLKFRLKQTVASP